MAESRLLTILGAVGAVVIPVTATLLLAKRPEGPQPCPDPGTCDPNTKIWDATQCKCVPLGSPIPTVILFDFASIDLKVVHEAAGHAFAAICLGACHAPVVVPYNPAIVSGRVLDGAGKPVPRIEVRMTAGPITITRDGGKRFNMRLGILSSSDPVTAAFYPIGANDTPVFVLTDDNGQFSFFLGGIATHLNEDWQADCWGGNVICCTVVCTPCAIYKPSPITFTASIGGLVSPTLIFLTFNINSFGKTTC